MVKDPATGRRVSRENPASEHRVAESPELRIVEPDVFKEAQDLKRYRGGLKPHAQRRSKHLLSGLLRCGSCGSGMSSAGSDRQGVRVRCSRAKESGGCPDPKTFYLATIEAAVLSGLREELRKPAVIAEYVREYHAERQRLAASANKVRARFEKRLAEIDQEAERCIDHLVKGIGDAQRIGARSKELAIEETKVRAELPKAPPAPKRCQPAPCRSGTLRNPNCEPADGSFRGACCHQIIHRRTSRPSHRVSKDHLSLRKLQLTQFGALATAKGSSSYFVEFRIGSRTARNRRVSLGKHGALTPSEARSLAKAKLGEVAKGVDVAQVKRDERLRLASGTFRDVCQRYIEQEAKHYAPLAGNAPHSGTRRHAGLWPAIHLHNHAPANPRAPRRHRDRTGATAIGRAQALFGAYAGLQMGRGARSDRSQPHVRPDAAKASATTQARPGSCRNPRNVGGGRCARLAFRPVLQAPPVHRRPP